MNKTANTDLFWRKRLNPRLFLVLLLTALVLTQIAVAQNTAMFRADPAHTGVYSNGSEQVVPLALLWQFPTSGWVTSTPAIADGLAYSISADGNLYAIDINTGQKVWSKSIGNSQSSFFVISSASVNNGIVYAGGFDNYLYAFDAKTGLERWRFQTGGVITSSPVMDTSNSFVYFVSSDGNLYAVHDGTEAWRFRLSAGGSSDTDPWIHNQIRSSPALDTATGIIYVGSWDNAVYAIRGGPVTSNGGTQVWKHATGGHVTSSPAIDKDNRFILVGCDDNQLYALKMDDNGNEAWKYRTSGDSLDRGWLIEGSPAVYNNVVYFGCGGYTFYAMDVRTHAVLWTFRTSLGTETSPAIANGNVYFGSRNGNVYALDMSSGEKKWEFATGDVVYSSPAVSNGVLYIGSNTGKVYAIGKNNAIANFTAIPRSGLAPLTVQFTDTSTGNPDSWYWDFGDGTTARVQNPSHIYTTTGNFTVTLSAATVSASNTTTRSDYISVKSPVIKFIETIGGKNDDFASISVRTADGGVLLVGTTKSPITREFHQNQDIVVAKYDATYQLQWIHCYGGSGIQEANYALELKDGGYLIVGGTSSNDGDIKGTNHGGFSGTDDVWVIKLKKDGTIEWQNTYGGTGSETGMVVIKNTDSSGNETSFVIGGFTESNDGDVSGKHSSQDLDTTRDAWVFSVNATGSHELLWQKCYGGTSDDEAKFMVKSQDGYSLVVVGYSASGDGDLQGIKTYDEDDAWIFTIDTVNPSHPVIYNHTYGGNSLDEALYIQPTPDGGYISTGFTESDDGDITTHFGETNSKDILVLKLNSDLSKQWIRTYGGSRDDIGTAVRVWPERNVYYILGSTSSNDHDITNMNHGGGSGTADIALLKIGYDGGLKNVWLFGGSDDDFGIRFGDRTDLSGPSYILGMASSNDGDLINMNHGGSSGTSDIAVIGFG